jgi:uncharacterized protein (DUF2384 family)
MTAEDVTVRAIEVFGSTDKATGWFDDPNRLFDGATPRALLDVSEAERRF